jgi:hypothetical protein
VAPGADLIDFGEAGNFSEVRNSTGVHDRSANVVDQLFLDELLAIVDGIENLADGERRSGMAANQAKTFLQLGGRGVFEPEQMIRFKLFAKAAGFYRRETMVRIVE